MSAAVTEIAPAEERAHAVLSASGAHRWLICTPSARLEDTLPNSTSAYAEEGTLAHEVAATELNWSLHRVSFGDYTAAWARFHADKRVTKDFKLAINAYVEVCKAKIAAARALNPDAYVCVEQKFDYSHLVPEGFGTGDLVIIADGVLEVIDLKFGAGVAVSPEHNEQEMLYGIGALAAADFLFDIDNVRLTIVQPRIGEGAPASWDIPVPDLLLWAQETLAPQAAIAWRGEGEFVPGGHCQFCRANPICRALAAHNLELTKLQFKEPELLSDTEIGDVLARVAALKTWAEKVASYALDKAKEGHRFPGFKMVRGRATRRYGDHDAVAAALLAGGVPEAVIYERSLLALGKLEKEIGKPRLAELLPAPLVTKPKGALTLVAVADKRPEVESSALEGFENLEPGETET